MARRPAARCRQHHLSVGLRRCRRLTYFKSGLPPELHSAMMVILSSRIRPICVFPQCRSAAITRHEVPLSIRFSTATLSCKVRMFLIFDIFRSCKFKYFTERRLQTMKTVSLFIARLAVFSRERLAWAAG